MEGWMDGGKDRWWERCWDGMDERKDGGIKGEGCRDRGIEGWKEGVSDRNREGWGDGGIEGGKDGGME